MHYSESLSNVYSSTLPEYLISYARVLLRGKPPGLAELSWTRKSLADLCREFFPLEIFCVRDQLKPRNGMHGIPRSRLNRLELIMQWVDRSGTQNNSNLR